MSPSARPSLGHDPRSLLAGLVVGVLLVAALAPWLFPSSTRALGPTPTPVAGSEDTVSVTGTGRVTVTPDTADLRLGVQAQRSTVKDARSAAADAMTKVLAALRADGVADRDLRTTDLSLQPQYDYSAGSTPRLIGYTMAESVEATVRDLGRVGAAVDDAIGAGATVVQGVTFRLADPSGPERQARAAAMADARAKADALAAAAGVTIVGVASIAETSAPTPVPVPYAGAAARDAVQTPIAAGTTDASVSVAVVYRLG